MKPEIEPKPKFKKNVNGANKVKFKERPADIRMQASGKHGVDSERQKPHTGRALGLHCGYELPTTPLVTDVHATHLGEVARQGGVLVKCRHQHRHPRKAPSDLCWLGVLLQGHGAMQGTRGSVAACTRRERGQQPRRELCFTED